MKSWTPGAAGVVLLPDGRRVRGRALADDRDPAEATPEFGLYLTAGPYEEAGWESRWVCWPDFLLPRTPASAIDALRDAYERSATNRVEIACRGGVGRTGTAIAILARFAGIPAADSVSWTRSHFTARAAETPWQRRFARRVELGPRRD